MRSTFTRLGLPAAAVSCLALLVLLSGAGHARGGPARPMTQASAATAPLARISGHARRWIPGPRTTWQWQLTTPVDQSVPAQMFDIDLFDNSAAVVASLHRRGAHVICYLDAGTYENFRGDAHRFPGSVLGKSNGWPGEKWLDIRRLSVLEPIMRARFQMCKRKGFDGVEADNVDGYTNPTGFPLTGAQQLTYNRWLAHTAHSLGLSIALKNDLDQARQLAPSFDYALDEQCFQYSECGKLSPFVTAHKAVFEVEYQLPTSGFCTSANQNGFMSMRKNLGLDAARQACW
jgi:hypothetical protein